MLTKLKITDYDIPPRGSGKQSSHNNPIKCALYRGFYYRDGGDREFKEGGFQGRVGFDVVNQIYWIWTGETARPSLKVGELLHVWLSAWYHGRDIFPITITFTEDTAEVECEDREAFLSFWGTDDRTSSANHP